MSNAIATTDTPVPATSGGMANPLKQMGDLFAQPAVKRSLPLIFMLGLIGAAALAWMMLSTPAAAGVVRQSPRERQGSGGAGARRCQHRQRHRRIGFDHRRRG
jgi:hypothetical protein